MTSCQMYSSDRVAVTPVDWMRMSVRVILDTSSCRCQSSILSFSSNDCRALNERTARVGFFSYLFRILRATCLHCYKLKITPEIARHSVPVTGSQSVALLDVQVEKYIAKLVLLRKGEITTSMSIIVKRLDKKVLYFSPLTLVFLIVVLNRQGHLCKRLARLPEV